MNNNNKERDERLSRALNAWKVDAKLPPRFQERVWQQIARAGQSEGATLWTVFRSWVELAFARRAVAFAYLAILLAVGSTAGFWSGHQRSQRIEAGLGERYLQSVDPYRAPMGIK